MPRNTGYPPPRVILTIFRTSATGRHCKVTNAVYPPHRFRYNPSGCAARWHEMPPDAAFSILRGPFCERVMFGLFERLLKPTETPEQPEPPAGLVGFYWHFARQAKG